MSEHTPAPWQAHQELHGLFVSARAFCIARLGDGYSENQQENARLIAAAPELLEALGSLLAYCANRGINTGSELDHEAVKFARSAVARATGEAA